jgi:hypothetical protein
VGVNMTGPLFIMYFVFVKHFRKVGIQWSKMTGHTLKKTSDSVRREVLFNILIECSIIMHLGRLIEMCLN